MTLDLPTSPADVSNAFWADLKSYYDALAQAPRDDPEAWLAEWNRLEEVCMEAAALANLAYAADTGNPAAEAAHLRWSRDIGPLQEEQQVRLSELLLETGYSRPGLEESLARFRNRRELFREESVPLQAELQVLQSEYQKLAGRLAVDWEGARLTVPRLLPFLESTERSVRERAFRRRAEAYLAERERFADLFDTMLELRARVARNAGFDNFRDYAHLSRNRFSYTPDDCLRWQEAVREVVVPAAARQRERRRASLGVAELRPWDLSCDPDGKPPLKPYETDEELEERAAAVFRAVDPDFGERFELMRREQLLDLPNRPGKRPGAFCTSFPHRRRPFVFGNLVGTAGDIRTLLHEMGHAFHGFECLAVLPTVWERQYGSEMGEVASMSMELLAAPHLNRTEGGFYDEEDHRRETVRHLESILELLPHIATVDRFQHWLYTDPGGSDRDARDARWLEIRAEFETGVDWSGLERERTARWYQQIHFFVYPFYYIEYGLAQQAALQIWRNSLADAGSAVRAYRSALALGGTRPLPDLYQAAGARLVFDAQGLADVVELVERKLEEADA